MNQHKIKIASYWATSCGGCDVSLLDTGMKVLLLADAADIVFWPILMDAKEANVEAMPKDSIDLCFFNGSIRSSENAKMAHLLRKKSKILVAFGACAQTGGIHGLINTTDTKTIKDTVFISGPSVHNPNGVIPVPILRIPEGKLSLPTLFETVKSLGDIVAVDYYIPGCPPAVPRLSEIIDVIIAGELPPKGSVLGATDKALCETCYRIRHDRKIDSFTRPHLMKQDPETCFLEQGLLCLGPVTRGGCAEQCIRGNMPCRGCYGVTPGVIDPGGAMIGVLASLIKSDDPGAIDRAVESLSDMLGNLYQFTYASSLLKRVNKK